jgi:hypothetical protein
MGWKKMSEKQISQFSVFRENVNRIGNAPACVASEENPLDDHKDRS